MLLLYALVECFELTSHYNVFITLYYNVVVYWFASPTNILDGQDVLRFMFVLLEHSIVGVQ